jgi:hypothetical protein
MPNITWGLEGTWNMGPLTGDPETYKVGLSAVDFTLWLGLVGLFLAGVGKVMKGNLMPIKDPKLGACLAFENY